MEAINVTETTKVGGPATSLHRSGFREAGAWMLGGAVLWWLALILMQLAAGDFFYDDSAREEALNIAADPGLFRAFHVLAGLGTLAVSVGVVVLGRRLRAMRPSRAVDAAAAIAVVGSLAWLVEIAVRMTLTVSDAEDVAAGTASPGDEPAIGSWPLYVLAGLAFLAPVLISWILARRRLPGRIRSLLVAALATLMAVAMVATLAPSFVYQFAVPVLGVVLLLSGRRS